MEATIFSGWIYDHVLPHAAQVKVAHPLLRAIAAAKKKNDKISPLRPPQPTTKASCRKASVRKIWPFCWRNIRERQTRRPWPRRNAWLTTWWECSISAGLPCNRKQNTQPAYIYFYVDSPAEPPAEHPCTFGCKAGHGSEVRFAYGQLWQEPRAWNKENDSQVKRTMSSATSKCSAPGWAPELSRNAGKTA
jgi:hypothetical protein